jgi:hypothetical protein
MCVLYKNNQTFVKYYSFFLNSVISHATGLHLLPPRIAGPLIHNAIIYRNSFLLQGSKIIRLSL